MSHYLPSLIRNRYQSPSETVSQSAKILKESPIKQNKDLTKLGHFVNGTLSNAAMVCLMQPGFTAKTFIMSGVGFPPATKLYNGAVVNALTGGPSEGVAFFAHSAACQVFMNKNSPVSDMVNLGASGFAGVVSAFVITPCERMMILRQLKEGSLATIMRSALAQEGGVRKTLFKGFVPTAWRDAMFNCGVLALNDIAQKHLEPITQNKTQKEILSGISVGAIVGSVSTPLDLVKTIMQSDTEGKHKSSLETAKEIIRKEGVKQLFKGMTVRSIIIGGATYSMAKSKEIIPNYLPDGLFHRE